MKAQYNRRGFILRWMKEHRDIKEIDEMLNRTRNGLLMKEHEIHKAEDVKKRYELKRARQGGLKMPDEGIYYNKEENLIYVVARANYGSGSITCKHRPANRTWWTKTVDILELAENIVEGSTIPLTLEEAKEIGLLTGICTVCGRGLSDAKSKEIGMGPVCRARMQEKKMVDPEEDPDQDYREE
jgi:hypothetical protein